MAEIVAKGHNGTVTFDGSFVTISRTGALARMSIGKGEKRIPLASIASVQWKPPGAIINGYIAFTVPGGKEKQSRFGSATTDASKDENAVVVTKKQSEAFLVLREAVEAAMSARGHGHPPAPDVMDQLRKLAELRDAGIVSPDEFEAKKADLLGRL
jgi:hypothetical protein